MKPDAVLVAAFTTGAALAAAAMYVAARTWWHQHTRIEPARTQGVSR